MRRELGCNDRLLNDFNEKYEARSHRNLSEIYNQKKFGLDDSRWGLLCYMARR